MLNYTTVKILKLQVSSLLHNGGLDTMVYHTVPQFRVCALAESPRESGVYMEECATDMKK